MTMNTHVRTCSATKWLRRVALPLLILTALVATPTIAVAVPPREHQPSVIVLPGASMVRSREDLSDTPSGESRRGFDPLATGRTGDRGQHLGGVACFRNAVVREPRLDELLEERSCEQVRPADLV